MKWIRKNKIKRQIKNEISIDANCKRQRNPTTSKRYIILLFFCINTYRQLQSLLMIFLQRKPIRIIPKNVYQYMVSSVSNLLVFFEEKIFNTSCVIQMSIKPCIFEKNENISKTVDFRF